MPVYSAPIRDIRFVLHDLLGVGQEELPAYAEIDRDTSEAILGEAGRIATEQLLPLNLSGDRAGCVLANGKVTTPKGFAEAFELMKQGGWPGLDLPEAYGGQGMPVVIGTAVGEIFSSANQAFTMYQGLTHGAASAILVHGTEDQKNTYLPKMVSCEWTGTMNLTEPHCGTDLGLMRSKAEPQADGSYKISGQKIFISAGEHDLAENIIHLVLARISGAPEGIKGISLFIVPKFLVKEDGSLGPRNQLSCGSIEEKMGIHGNATCVMNYDGATGYLLGEAHKGMRAMFTMMNEARLGVGMQGLAQAEIAYQNAAAYARDRLQGRDVTGAKNPNGPADPLIVHPDIRRCLTDLKGFTEGARALMLWAASLIDRSHSANDADAEGLVSLLIPVIKAYITDKGFDAAVVAQQIFGGHGYVEEWGMSQYVRDARIAMIYEGANGIQALDLVGRKLPHEGGKYMRAFFAEIKATLADAPEDAQFQQEFCAPLKSGAKDLESALAVFLSEGMKNPHHALSGATDFLHLFGTVAFGMMWLRMANLAHRGLAGEAAHQGEDFYRAKLKTAQAFFLRQMPSTALHLARVKAGSTAVMALAESDF